MIPYILKTYVSFLLYFENVTKNITFAIFIKTNLVI